MSEQTTRRKPGMEPDEFLRARRRLGLTQAQLAKIMGMPQQAIDRLEKGKQRVTKIHAAFMRILLASGVRQKTEAYYTGQALAIIDAALPTGLSAVALNNAMSLPGMHMGRLIRQASATITPELDGLLGAVINNVREWPVILPPAQQADCLLGWHHMRANLNG